MTLQEKITKLKQLADAMYNSMQNLTTDTTRIRKAMQDYRQFVIYELKESKVNNATEKIYLLPDGRNSNGLSLCWYEAPYETGAIEYIRTDAFIKKACSGIKHLLSGYIIKNFNFGDYYNDDKFIEDFKNYIKRE